jgi:hypothetical protein
MQTIRSVKAAAPMSIGHRLRDDLVLLWRASFFIKFLQGSG